MTDIEITETENIGYNGSSKCNRCSYMVYWNDACSNRRTGKKVPLDEPYIPASGVPPKGHICRRNIPIKDGPPTFNADSIGSAFDKSMLWEFYKGSQQKIRMELQDKLTGRDSSGLTYAEREIEKDALLKLKNLRMSELWKQHDFNTVKKQWKISK